MAQLEEKFSGPKNVEEVLQYLHEHPEEMTKDMFLELTDWAETTYEALGCRSKERQGVIAGVLDSEGDDVKIVANFFRLYPLVKDGEIPGSAIAQLQDTIREGINTIILRYSQKYENIVVVSLPTPSWMYEK